MRYRRADVPDESYFFTVNLADRANTLLVDYVTVLREAVRVVKQRPPPFVSMLLWCYRTICMQYGHCRRGMRILPNGGC